MDGSATHTCRFRGLVVREDCASSRGMYLLVTPVYPSPPQAEERRGHRSPLVAYREARGSKQRAIGEAKKRAWDEFLATLDSDP